MPSPMRDFLSFAPPDGGDDDELGALIQQMQAQRAPRLPDLMMPRRPVPLERPQQTMWDLLPQVLAGAADTVNAGAGMRTDTLGRVMGTQRGMRDQAYGDALSRQAVDYNNQMADRQGNLQRYQMESAAQNQDYTRKSKLAELIMMHQALQDQQQKKSAMRAIFEQGLQGQYADAGNPKDLDKTYQAALEKTGGDPQMMEAAKAAYQKRLQGIVQQQQPGPFQKYIQGATGTDNSFWPQIPRGFIRDWWDETFGPQPQYPPQMPGVMFAPQGGGMPPGGYTDWMKRR